MSDTIVHIGENSPEQVALKLFEMVAKVEERKLYVDRSDRSGGAADRKYILDTYAECLLAVTVPSGRSR